jgi:hypothetical protein
MVKELEGSNTYPLLMCTNYEDWSLLMKVEP